MGRQANFERNQEIERQREAEQRKRLKEEKRVKEEKERERQLRAQKEKERPRQSNNKPKPFTDSPAPARTLPQSPIQNKEEVTTFGPFSAFKNFPSFPRNVLDGQAEEDPQNFNSNPSLRGPNLLPTRPTGPPPSNRNQGPP